MNTMNDLKKDLESKAELIIYFLKKYPIFKTIKTNISFGHSSTLIADLAVLSHHLKLKYPKWNIVASWDGLSVSAIESE